MGGIGFGCVIYIDVHRMAPRPPVAPTKKKHKQQHGGRTAGKRPVLRAEWRRQPNASAGQTLSASRGGKIRLRQDRRKPP